MTGVQTCALPIFKAMVCRRIQVNGARILIIGLTFKENCPDLRNTRVVDIVNDLREYGYRVEVYDPWVSPEEARREYGIEMVAEPEAGVFDAIVLAVAHYQFVEMGAAAIRQLGRENHVLYDLKYLLPPEASDLRL